MTIGAIAGVGLRRTGAGRGSSFLGEKWRSAARGTLAATNAKTKIDDFMQEVAQARIYDGVHYRTSTEVGTVMGKQIGELAAAKYLRPLK